MKILFLPSSAPDDTAHGRAEDEWPAVRASFVGVDCASIHFDTLVWYTQQVRREASAKICEACGGDLSDAVLVGCSKSGCGVVNLALDHPGRFHAVIAFDAPLANEDPNRFMTLGRFYPDAQSLRCDVPLLRVRKGGVCGRTRLILVHGEAFSDELTAFAAELEAKGGRATVISDVKYPHRWNSGWIMPAIREALQQPAQRDAVTRAR